MLANMKADSLTPYDSDALDLALAKRIMSAVAAAKTERRISTVDLANRYNEARPDDPMQPTTLNNLLAGKRKALTLGELIGFARALDLDPLELVPELNTRDDAALRDKYRKELISDLLRMP